MSTFQTDLDANKAAADSNAALITKVGVNVGKQNDLITQQAAQIAALQAQTGAPTAAQLAQLEATTAEMIKGGTDMAGFFPGVDPPVSP